MAENLAVSANEKPGFFKKPGFLFVHEKHQAGR